MSARLYWIVLETNESNIYLATVFDLISKKREDSWKYYAQRGT